MGFNSAFKGLILCFKGLANEDRYHKGDIRLSSNMASEVQNASLFGQQLALSFGCAEKTIQM